MNRAYNELEIAIIGMSCQFTGSGNYLDYWRNIETEKHLIRAFTDEDLLKRGVSADLLKNKLYVKSEGVLDDKDLFDSSFFGYTPDEAAAMDPQIRIFHKQCWAALEDAGYSPLIGKQKIGLFAGASKNYNWKIYTMASNQVSKIDPFYLDIISSPNFISSLISYKLNLQGAAFFIDTACSTSLAAVHSACRNLLTRECTIALAGGVSIHTQKQKGYLYQDGMIASSDGHCRAFDKNA
ncbi:polyketide synthase, partial [Pedobacter jeongneungensis]|uniref:polyketide synthase n=1 Tax=Pedobacter jeongneungensis TaxID=947309 RepID=UPI0031E5AE1E